MRPRLIGFMAASLLSAGCGSGGSSGDGQGGALSARALWQQRSGAAIVAGSPLQQTGDGRFGPELPGSARTVRFLFTSSAGDACCVAVDPRSVPFDPDRQQRTLVLPELPVGPGSLVISAFPTDFAPAPAGVLRTCTTRPENVGQSCDPTRTQSPSFSSDSHPVSILPGIDSDAGDVLVRAFPFVVPGTISPADGEEVVNPVAAGSTVADAVSGVDPSSILLQLSSNGVIAQEQPLQLQACNDLGGDPCSTNRDLRVTGFVVTRVAQEITPGNAQGRIRASNLAAPPQSVDFSYAFSVQSAPRTPTRTATPVRTATRPAPSVTATANRTATRTSTRTPTRTAPPSRTPTSTRRVTPTSVRSRTRTRTPTPGGTPTINFIGASPLTVSARPEFLTTADFNSDGRADLVVISPLSTELNVLAGSSESATGFSSVAVFRFGERLRSPAVGDLNADGELDIVVPDPGRVGVWVLLGNGDATFASPTFFAVGNAPFAVAVADFDGRPGDDLAVADRQQNSVLIRLSNGTTPLQFSSGPDLFSGINPEEIVAVDLDLDGQMDVTTLNVGGAPALGVHLWQGLDGTGSPVFDQVVRYGAGDRPSSLIVSDVDGDGDEDLILLNRQGGNANHELAVFLSLGDGLLEALPSLTLDCPFVASGACPSRGLAAGDFERDGNVDLAVVTVDPRGSSGGDAVRILRGRGDGGFADGPVILALEDAVAISAGRYGGAGRIDLAICSSSETSVQRLVNISILGSGGGAEVAGLSRRGLFAPRYDR